MIRLSKLIDSRRLTQAEAARLFGVTQPKISDLVRGKIYRVNRADLEANSVSLPLDAGVFTREVGALAKAYFGAIDGGDIESMISHLDPNGFNIHVYSPDGSMTSEKE